MKFILAFLLAAPLAAFAQTAYNKPDPKPAPAPLTVHEQDRRGMCDGGGRAFTCIAVGSLAIYGVARAAGWKGFGFEWDGGKKRADLTPINGGGMFTVSAAVE